ncbi:MAG: LysR family transcriptional regulator [Pseudomonadota bacterium]
MKSTPIKNQTGATPQHPIKFNRRWLPLNALRAFEATGTSLSFTVAAEKLGVTQSAVSRQVKRLEDLVGVELIERNPTNIRLTEAGKSLLYSVTDSYNLLERSLQSLLREGVRETVKLSIAPSFALYNGPALFAEFAEAFPWVNLEVDSRDIGHEFDEYPFDVAIVFSKPQITNNSMDLLWMESVAPLCSPTLLESQKSGDDFDQVAFLDENPLLHVKTQAGQYHAWETWARSAGFDTLDTHTGLTFDKSSLAVRCAQQGQGLVVADHRLFQTEIDEGRLCMPFSHTCASGFGYYLVIKQDDLGNEGLHFIRNWIVEHFTEHSRDS